MDEIDYQKTVENLQKIIQIMFSNENRYFELLTKMSELQKYSVCGDKMADMKIADQVQVLEATVKLLEIEKHLCEKYGFDAGE